MMSEATGFSERDELTNLRNRRALVAIGEDWLNDLKTADSAVGCLFIDVDKFVLVNHFLGHDVGDQALKQIAVRIARAARDEDATSRFGGDQFVVLVRDAQAGNETVAAAVRLLREFDSPIDIQNHVLALGNESNPFFDNPAVSAHSLMMKVSIGLSISEPGNTFLEVLSGAHKALMDAKIEGRARARSFQSTWMAE